MGTDDRPLLTIVDFRNENFLNPDNPPPRIKTNCPTVKLLMDDIRDPRMRRKIPREGMVITVTETGNRDTYINRYLSGFHYTNIKALHFGMRSWIKQDYPMELGRAGDARSRGE